MSLFIINLSYIYVRECVCVRVRVHVCVFDTNFVHYFFLYIMLFV